MKASDIGVGIQEAQQPFGKNNEQESADAAARNGSDSADDHDQKDLIGHG